MKTPKELADLAIITAFPYYYVTQDERDKLAEVLEEIINQAKTEASITVTELEDTQ